MSISHWGIFPGYMVPALPPLDWPAWAHTSAAVWRPCDFDLWCSFRYMYGSQGQ